MILTKKNGANPRQMVKVSIVIPIYNLESYVAKCLESCINQTLSDIEIICVNDGSKDNSLSIIQNFAATDPRIRIIDTPNQGVVRAREMGVAQAIGAYITFVDGDDYITLDALDTLYAKAVQTDADIVNGAGVKLTPNETSFYSRGEQIQNQEEFIRTSLQRGEFYLHARLFRRSLFEQRTLFCPPEITHNEDVIMVLSLAFGAKKIVSCPAEVYNYMFRETSVTNSFSEKQYLHILAVRRMVLKIFREKSLWEQHQSELLFFMMNALFFVLRYGNPKILLPEDFKLITLRNLFFGNVRKMLKNYHQKSDFRWIHVISLAPKLFAKMMEWARGSN